MVIDKEQRKNEKKQRKGKENETLFEVEWRGGGERKKYNKSKKKRIKIFNISNISWHPSVFFFLFVITDYK